MLLILNLSVFFLFLYILTYSSWHVSFPNSDFDTCMQRFLQLSLLELQVNFASAKQVTFLSCPHRVVSLAAVQGSSSPADQSEHGAAEGGEGPPRLGPDRQSEALAGAGLVEGEPAGWEVTELAAGASGDSRPGR